jgi:excisionase family DNA binding protein
MPASALKAPLPALDVHQRYSVPEAIAYLRTSRRSIYELIAEGRIRPIKEGRRTFISGQSIAALSQAPA